MEIVNTKGKQNKNKTGKKHIKTTKNTSVFVWTLEGVFDVEIDNTHTHTHAHKRTHTHTQTTT